jgi:hypothetical protein
MPVQSVTHAHVTTTVRNKPRQKARKMSETKHRWKEGIPHDPRSITLAKSIAKIDSENEDFFDWKFGGDGDNGEALMYLLDIHFAETDTHTAPQGSEPTQRRTAREEG